MFSLGYHSKECGNEGHLVSHLSFFHALHLPFSDHVHHLESLSCLPCGLKREKAHPRLRQALEKAMVLLDEIAPILDLPQFTSLGKLAFCFQFSTCFGGGGVFIHVHDSWQARMRGGEGCEQELLGSFRVSRRYARRDRASVPAHQPLDPERPTLFSP